MATIIRWIDNNKIETHHRIYKSSTFFTKDNLPDILVELGPDVTEYEDVDGTDGENWYIVSALLNDYEVFSEPFITGLTTAFTHDIFGDGSAVATYNFDGDSTDLGGNYDGTPTSTTFTIGVVNQAADLTNGYIEYGDNNFDLGLSSLTFSFWVYRTGGSGNQYLFSKSLYGAAPNRWALGISGNVLSCIFSPPSTNNLETSVGVTPITIGQWYHVVFVIDRVNGLSIYVDGVLDLSGGYVPPAGTDYQNAYVAVIGAYNNKDGGAENIGPFVGYIDQTRIFNRALTQEEVDILYQEGAMFL